MRVEPRANTGILYGHACKNNAESALEHRMAAVPSALL